MEKFKEVKIEGAKPKAGAVKIKKKYAELGKRPRGIETHQRVQCVPTEDVKALMEAEGLQTALVNYTGNLEKAKEACGL